MHRKKPRPPSLAIPGSSGDSFEISNDGILRMHDIEVRGNQTYIAGKQERWTPALTADLTFDRIRFDRMIGQGTFGTVRIVYVPGVDGSQQTYACKSVPLTGDPEETQTITNAIHSLSRIKGTDHIVHCHGLFLAEGGLNMVMDCMHGSVRDMLDHAQQNHREIGDGVIAKIALDVLEALVYMHDVAHVLHRDITPGNILWHPVLGVRVSDLGCSKPFSAGEAMETMDIVGTLAYNAPEKLDACAAYGKPADVWAYGLTMLEITQQKFPLILAPEGDLETTVHETAVAAPELSSSHGPHRVRKGISTDHTVSVKGGGVDSTEGHLFWTLHDSLKRRKLAGHPLPALTMDARQRPQPLLDHCTRCLQLRASARPSAYELMKTNLLAPLVSEQQTFSEQVQYCMH
eukprot:Clim_evm75s108 gene=Clim_evmTU75s108